MNLKWAEDSSKSGLGMEAVLIKKEGRIFYGWFIVAVSFLCWFAADAFGWYTFGIFIGPMTSEFGWTTLGMTGAMTFRTVAAGLLGLIIGPLADTRHGARVIMSIGVVITGAVALTVSRINNLWQFYLLYGLVGALGTVAIGGLVTNTIIAKWFVRKRGRAMGISTMGVSAAGLVFVPLVHYLISNYGWRTTLIVLGIVIWVLTFPVIFIIRRRPEDMGLMPDGDDPEAIAIETRGPDSLSVLSSGENIWTLREALRTRTLWLLLIGFNIIGLSLFGAIIHFFPYIEDKGFSSDVATAALTTFAFCALLVKIPWGLIAEKIHVRKCIISCYIGCAIGLVVLINSDTVFSVFLYSVMYGIALGGDMVLQELMWANYYGRTFLGTIRGFVMPFFLISMAGGPLFAAWLRDITGNYNIAYTLFCLAFIIGSLFIYLAKPPERS
ncbi:MAG: MFS transporter [Deltaproteobacteria bacterium]|nr:MFS transporter [Deltaproteobacteria bacterium]MBW2323443.1 MFS transporter [Deltaproteobacteria bacterium]